MIIGYTILDPLVVLFFAAMAIRLLTKNAERLVAWLPAALSLYFIVPIVTLLSVGQVVSLILTARMFLRQRVYVAPAFKPVMVLMIACFVLSLSYAILDGGNTLRTFLRTLNYLGLLAVFLFTYEVGRSDAAYEMFVKGLTILGIVLAVYGVYQIVAVFTGLPVRGIVRGTSGSQIVFENGFLRINSFASEPKRLGFVLFVCGLAAFEWARWDRTRRQKLKLAGGGILFVSLLPLAGSYFLALALFAVALAVLFPRRGMKFLLVMGLGILALMLTPDSQISTTLVDAYERRSEEVDVGLDGQRVYRQEFYAQNYLENHPEAAIIGLGVGRYYEVLNEEYGSGVGVNEFGGLIPMNSSLLEMVFDTGGVFTFLFYLSTVVLIFRLKKRGEMFLTFSLLFLLAQSLSIQCVPFIVLFAAIGAARLAIRSPARSTLPVQPHSDRHPESIRAG